MKFIAIKLKIFAGTLLLCTTSVTPGVFGQQQPQRLSRDTLIATAREIMGAARYCALRDGEELSFDVRDQRCLKYRNIKNLQNELTEELARLRTNGTIGTLR